MAAVVSHAQKREVGVTVDPGADVLGGDAGEVGLQQGEVDAVLEGELDVRVVALQRLGQVALGGVPTAVLGGEVAVVRTILAAPLLVLVEVVLVRVVRPWLVLGVVDGVAVADLLVVGGDVAGVQKPPKIGLPQ
ncbi:hypothetical protein ORV05_05035 [Amycolatopsis cynarae]|uniref:Uncharacterized protein n=1 Tax=Amycolatopsis cynarae TaxID=2995223 RepID=A0ABY7B4B6_9PSEU|nr:hypothetical protein [Amycolatopsis sp. HUAS 11-8]WAL67157.1 hypothetical protein ORV05_05035 [Amycolatopsis sp. HUAS 11-8]